ncbi:exodeoxyribonuclease III [Rarobacter incanus]|uniref:Exodeoxyribonuclease-3 n=1 Tax=Rarobacter incanus TaxID=153494 RepID=A0A542SRB4_9MICO|nr:exodeoxyribonuclease III [Rarobacter incanus]TQK77152.1 exodeoxyribonuclease-3 [Rarobacter incanus]
MLKIATINVNGIRAAAKRGLVPWIETQRPDVLLLQEVRANDDIVADLLPGWNIAHQACRIKGRAGVAIATTLALGDIRTGAQDEEPDVDTGRWIEADIITPSGTALTVVSAYLHSGTVGTIKMDQKYAHLDVVTDRMAHLAQRGGKSIVGGDINIAHHNDDIKNWKGNLKAAGFLPEERAYLDRWFDELGFVDVGRAVAGPGPGPYTWWSWRGKAFDNDAGWRIDYQIATPELAATVKSAVVDRAAAYDQRFSDHAPLIVEYDI